MHEPWTNSRHTILCTSVKSTDLREQLHVFQIEKIPKNILGFYKQVNISILVPGITAYAFNIPLAHARSD